MKNEEEAAYRSHKKLLQELEKDHQEHFERK